MSGDIEIRFVKSWPSGDIVDLYKSGGWWKDSWKESGISPMIKGSFLFALAVEKSTGRAVGMGRVISDGVSDAYIQDFVVLKEYRKLGIGKRIFTKLVDECLSRGLLWLGIIAEPGTEEFYISSGFLKMKDHIPVFRTGQQ